MLGYSFWVFSQSIYQAFGVFSKPIYQGIILSPNIRSIQGFFVYAKNLKVEDPRREKKENRKQEFFRVNMKFLPSTFQENSHGIIVHSLLVFVLMDSHLRVKKLAKICLPILIEMEEILFMVFYLLQESFLTLHLMSFDL